MIENADVLYPDAQPVNSLSILDKYKSDLDFLKNGKLTIERQYAEDGISDEEANEKLKNLNNAIKKLEKNIKELEDVS